MSSMVDIKWTPAAGAGSLRFTKRARDALGEDYSQWLDDGAEAADAALEVGLALRCAMRRVDYLGRGHTLPVLQQALLLVLVFHLFMLTCSRT